jgi:hypothetical protein
MMGTAFVIGLDVRLQLQFETEFAGGQKCQLLRRKGSFSHVLTSEDSNTNMVRGSESLDEESRYHEDVTVPSEKYSKSRI